MDELLAEWDAAYRAFHGHFDTPVAKRKDNSEYAEDARKRLREFNRNFRAALKEMTNAADR